MLSCEQPGLDLPDGSSSDELTRADSTDRQDEGTSIRITADTAWAGETVVKF